MSGTITPSPRTKTAARDRPGSRARRLVVTADDFGIGPMTSRGILDLAARGRVTCSVLLVNSPHAEASVADWRDAGSPMELGWHPCLTLDRPVSDPSRVSSLVDGDGRFFPLGAFLKRLMTGRVRREHLREEMRGQLRRFLDLVGATPTVVNAHHHLHAFPLVGAAVAEALGSVRARPYLRRVREPWRTLAGVPGARVKRLMLSTLGAVAGSRADRLGFAGNDWLAGVTDNASVSDPEFFARWVALTPGRDVELMCHPGGYDPTLNGRDDADGGLDRRVREFALLNDDRFLDACRAAGFELTAPSRIAFERGGSHGG